MPMSPWARASPIRTLVTADCSVITPPSSSGTPSMATPSSTVWSRISFGVSRLASASSAAGRIFSSAKARPPSWNICCSSSGVRSKRPFDLPFFWRAGLPSDCAALKVRPAGVGGGKAVLGALEEGVLDLLADADAIQQVGAGEAVQRPQAVAHPALRHPFVLGRGTLLVLVLPVVLAVLLCSCRTWPSRCGVPFLASRTAKRIS